jgi:hypothetical protein
MRVARSSRVFSEIQLAFVCIPHDRPRFFVRCEDDGVKLENCTPYIREWMEREKE